MEAHVRFKGFPSVAVALSGEILGGDGLSKTVNSTDLEWSSIPVPASFRLHLNCPLSRL